MNTSPRKLGILLSTPPENNNLKTAVFLADAALSQRVQTYLYLVDEGVKNTDSPEIEVLHKKGLKLFICAYGAQRHGISTSEKAVFCGLVVLSDLIKGCDRFVAFN
ncbi:MAG: DsrE family protein [Nitrospiria bacterium]